MAIAFALFFFVIGTATLFGLSLAGSVRDEDYIAMVNHRFERDADLRATHDAFVAREGRAPSAAELWRECPPS